MDGLSIECPHRRPKRAAAVGRNGRLEQLTPDPKRVSVSGVRVEGHQDFGWVEKVAGSVDRALHDAWRRSLDTPSQVLTIDVGVATDNVAASRERAEQAQDTQEVRRSLRGAHFYLSPN